MFPKGYCFDSLLRKLGLAVAFLVFLVGVMDAQPRKSRKNRGADKVAREHIQYEEYEDAIPHLQSLLQQDPGSAYYNYWMGKSLYLTYKKNKALPYFEKVDRINPEVDEEFHYYFALTLHYNLLYDKAISQYREELERHEPNSQAFREINNRIQQCIYAKNLKKKKETDLVKINNLGKSVNTPYAEHSPVIAKGDSVLIFTARRPDSKGAQPEAHFYDEDVYISHKTETGWTQARNIETPVNSKGHDATISITQDGKRLYIYRHKKAGGLYVTDFDEVGKKWKEPKKIQKPLNSKYYEASICESPDGNTLYFTSDRPGGFGGRDIYRVNKLGEDDWSEPENLGPVINTPFDEDAPFIHPDGITFYYSSNGPKSIGGFDIFVTEMDTTTGSWLPPLNMGPPVNTPDDEIYFVLSASGLEGYYSSGKEGGFGEKDIYQIKFPYFRYPRRAYVIEVVGIVQDVESLDTLAATVRLKNGSTDEVLDSVKTTAEARMYQFELDPENSYSLEVVANGYEKTFEEFTTPRLDDEDLTVRKDILVKRPKSVKEEVYLPEIQHVYFDFDEADLRQESRNELDMIVAMLRQNDEMGIRVMGHTDFYGTYDYNVELSQERSTAVYQYLLAAGIDENRIEVASFSENKPIETNEDDTGRQYNRRVEFRFFRDGKSLFSSVKLRRGAEPPLVDHTRPKGLPGYDNPEGEPVAGMAKTMETQGGQEVSDDFVFVQGGEEPSGHTGKFNMGNTGKSEIKSGDKLNVNGSNASGDSKLPEGFSLNHIYFDFDASGLRTDAQEELARLATLMRSQGDLKLEVRGHTDSFGTDDYNQILSEKRCRSAIDYLVQSGIPADNVSFKGFSENQPLSTNASPSGRQQNRRVEFVLKRGAETLMVSTP